MNKAKPAYQFKLMKGLTFWTRLLMIALMVGMLFWAVGIVLSMQGAQGIHLASSLLIILGIFLLIPMYFASGIVTLCWVYGASRNAHVLRPGGLHSTPGWAVGWWFVPFASLYKPYEAIRDIWIASRGRVNEKFLPGSPVIVIWWWMFLIGNIVLRFSNNDEPSDDLVYASTPGNWGLVTGLLISAAATWLFFLLVGQIYKDQLASNARAAEVF